MTSPDNPRRSDPPGQADRVYIKGRLSRTRWLIEIVGRLAHHPIVYPKPARDGGATRPKDDDK